jgi:hypothetical protein
VFGLVKYSPEIAEPVPRDHRANIRIGLESFNRRGENRSGSEFLGASHNHIIKFVVLGLVDDKLLDADAVLTSVLAEPNSVKRATVRGMVGNVQDTTHPDTDVSVQVGTRQDDSRVLPSQFQSQRGHVLRGSERDLATDFFRSDKRDVLDDR